MRHVQSPGPAELAPGLFLFTSSVWQMNSAVLCSGGEALVVDPGFFPSEVEAAGEAAREGDEQPALARLEAVPYRGRPVPDHLRGVHQANARLVLDERRSLPG